MKKVILMILVLLIVANISACNFGYQSEIEEPLENIDNTKSNFEETDEKTTESEEPTETVNMNGEIDGKETIARTKSYHYYKVVGSFELGCEIYNAAGEIVLSERSQRPLTVSEIDTDLIEIRIGYGTGISGRRYFSIEKNQLSEEFFYVVANHGTKIAYLTYSNGGLNDRKLMIQDIYQPLDSGQCFTLNFSPDHTPVIEAKFSEDGTTLFLTYFEGQIYATKEAEISLE